MSLLFVRQSLWHPFDMLREILGPRMFRKLAIAALLALIASAIGLLGPMILNSLVTKALG